MKMEKDPVLVNWAKNQRWSAAGLFHPETEAEIIEIVRKYDKVKAVGAGHSWSDIAKNQGAVISLDKFNQILEVDKEKRRVRVQAGIRMKELNRQLKELGLAVINQGSIDQQSLAGAVSTGTHGSGLKFGILGSQWLEFKMIKADGSVITVNKEKDPELFHASVVNLGALGIITEVLLQATDAFNLHDITVTRDFTEVIDNLETYARENDHFKIWWLTPVKKAVIYRYKRTNEQRNDSRFRRYFKDEIFSVAAYRSLVFCAKLFPQLAIPFNRLLTSQMKGPLDRIEESDKVFIVPEPPLHLETEWAFDLKDAPEVLKAHRKLLSDKKYRMNFIQEIRFTKGDDFWLSGCYGRDTMWLGLYCFKHEDFEGKLKEFEKLAMRFNGRPHWGKLFNVKKEYLEKQYPRYADFNNLRKEMDPKGKFSNAYLKRLFD